MHSALHPEVYYRLHPSMPFSSHPNQTLRLISNTGILDAHTVSRGAAGAVPSTATPHTRVRVRSLGFGTRHAETENVDCDAALVRRMRLTSTTLTQ